MKLECLICGGPARGTHLGVRACNSCASFFRRTVLLQKKYSCKKTVKCNIDLVRYVKCPACRFQKCLELGMNWRALQANNSNFSKVPQTPNSNSTLAHLFSPVGKVNDIFTDLKEAYKRLKYRRTIFYKANSSSVVDENMKRTYLEVEALSSGLFQHHEIELKLYLSLINENSLLAMLPGPEKRLIFHNAARSLQALEILYASWMCSEAQNSKCFAMPNGVYTDVKNLCHAQNQSNTANFDAIYKIHVLTFVNTLEVINTCITNVQPTNDDLVFLIGLIIFDPTTQNISKTTMESLQLTRNQLLEGFMTRCDSATCDGMLRLDRVLSIIASVKIYVHKLRENLIMMRRFDVIGCDQLFDQVWDVKFEM
uniref:Nuclear receptor domain-containing protein n=1 Tax=Panagrellus redivivus TaxID=6233 RepID=A0A7E4VRT8_PANRE